MSPGEARSGIDRTVHYNMNLSGAGVQFPYRINRFSPAWVFIRGLLPAVSPPLWDSELGLSWPAVSLRTDLLLLDDPQPLDIAAVEWLEGYLNQWDGAAARIA